MENSFAGAKDLHVLMGDVINRIARIKQLKVGRRDMVISFLGHEPNGLF